MLPGTLGVPVPTVLVSEWQLTARISVMLDRLGEVDDDDDDDDESDYFDQHSVETALTPAAAGFTVVSTKAAWAQVKPATPLTVLLNSWEGIMVALQPRSFAFSISLGRVEAAWTASATSAGTVMVASADLPGYWQAISSGREPTFDDAFSKGCWAALAPFVTGDEADVRTWPGAENLGL